MTRLQLDCLRHEANDGLLDAWIAQLEGQVSAYHPMDPIVYERRLRKLSLLRMLRTALVAP